MERPELETEWGAEYIVLFANYLIYLLHRGKARYARPEEMPNKIKGLKGRLLGFASAIAWIFF
ncbi:hypothetical protein TRIUR3_16231 [Triticum urartu]|uniref:Uncharacterized protein n=1 Tax=Triticum urartu TaxID=4572 RepID=M8AP45_TRIUA|nr:hypothetical protein TRIUR3_16231 [Triticum urartu]